MYSNRKSFKGAASLFLSWQFLVFKFFILALVSIYLTRPTGSLAGSVAFEEAGFHLYNYSLQDRKISAVAIGPRGALSDERGVWVNPDGSFKVDQLPVGEYEIRVRAPGYSTEYINDIFVDEAQTTSVPHIIQMSMLQPSVTLASNVHVYTTHELPKMWTNASASKNVTINIYRRDLMTLSHSKAFKKLGFYLSTDLSLQQNENKGTAHDLFGQQKPDYHFTRDVQTTWGDDVRSDFAFEKSLPPGDYMAVADALSMNGKDHNYASLLFQVTDLGLIVKKAPDKTLVRAINLNTLKPVMGATIKVKNTKSGETTMSVATNKDGFAELGIKQQSQIANANEIIVMGTAGESHAYDGINYWQGNEGRYSTFMYTDRPVYRLGQTVNYKGIIRTTSATGLVNPGQGTGVSVKVEDPENAEIQTEGLVTNDHGTFHGSLVIPADGKTGSYQIAVTLPDNTTSYSSFSIEQYRKPEFQVEVTPTVPRVVAGNKAQMHIKANYYFGAPVANARVKYSVYSATDYGLRYTLMPRPKYYQFYDDWSDDDESNHWYQSYAGGGDYNQTGYAMTDANGEATVVFDTKGLTHDSNQPYDSSYADQSYRVETEVTDMTRMSVTGTGSILVTPANFELFVNPTSYVTKVGDKFNVDVNAIDYDGKPVVNQPLTLKLVRYLYDRAKAEYRGVDTKATVQTVTNKDGSAHASFTTNDQWPCDTFYVIAESNDSTGHLAEGVASIWVANDRQPFFAWNDAQAAQQPLDIKLDKHVYKPGETAKIMVSAPLRGTEGVEAIVSVEGTSIYSYKLVPLNATAQLIEVPIKKEYVPNAFISVTFVGKRHQFYTTQKIILVSPEDNFLNINVSTDKQKYKPGENAKYTIKATHTDGTPAPNAELSLGVVDESIYAIMPDTTENIQKFFYSKRANWVVTSSSFPEEYSGGPDKTEPRVRKDFKDTAAWLPDLITNKDGIAIATIKLPDNLTTWRATVRGIDADSSVGATIQKMIVTQDLIVRLGMPRFFTQEDQSTVAAVVHNYTDRAQSVKVTFSPSQELTTTKGLVQTLNVPPDKTARFDWPVTAVLSGSATVHIKAVGQTAGDAIEQHVPIRPLGIPAFSVKSGLLTDDNASVKIPVGGSADTAAGTTKQTITMSGSSIGPVLGNFNSLIDYPYGCTEQTLSRMVPSIVAFKLHKELGLPLSNADRKKFDAVYAKSMEKLTLYRHADGGWGWWQNDDSNPYLTCLVLDGMNLLNSCHVYADTKDDWLKGGVKWLKTGMTALQKQMSDPHVVQDYWQFNEYRTDMCFMLYSVGLFEPLPQKETDWIMGQYKLLPPEGLSYLAMALHKGGRDADAQKVYDRLIFFANVDGDYLDWDHTPALVQKLNDRKVADEYTYRFTGVESTALALRAVLAMEPKNTQRIESVKQWLLIQRTKDGWENTKTTAEVFEVLLQEEIMSRSKWPANFTATATLQEKLLKDYTFNQGNIYQAEQSFAVPQDNKPNETLTITKNGSGRLYYTSLMTCFRKLKPGDEVTTKGYPSGLKLTRKFYHVVAGPMKSDGSIHFKTVPVTDGQIKAGETVLMKVLVDSPIRLPYVMLEAALPSGAEVVQGSAEDQNIDNSGDDKKEGSMEGDWSWPWWTHQDVLDDRIVFFGTTLPAGKSEFHTLVRMEIPGKLNVDPVWMEGMYTKKARGYSQIDSLNVTE